MKPSTAASRAVGLLPLLMVFFAGFAFALQSLLIQPVLRNIGPFTVACCRSCIQLLLSAGVIAYRCWLKESIHIFGESPTMSQLLFIRSIFGFLGNILMLEAIERLPIGDAMTLAMLSPMIASFLGIYFLSEPWYLSEMLAAAVSLVGIGLVAHPVCLLQGDCASVSGVIFALLCAFSSAGAFLTIRMLGTVVFVPWFVIAFTQALGILLFSLPFAVGMEPLDWSSLSQGTVLTVLLAGTIGTSGQFAMTLGMQREKSALASAMRSSDVLFGYILQATYTASSPDALSVSGAALVVLGMLVVVLRKQFVDSSGRAGDESRESVLYAIVSQDDAHAEVDEKEEPA